MSHLIPFNHPEFGNMRTMQDQDGAWVCGKDFCRMCGDSNPARSLARLDDDEKRIFLIDTPGGVQETVFVNEPGSYNLIFAMRPQKANGAKGETDAYHPETQARIGLLARVKRWVFHEVLPSVREHGAYLTPEKIEQALLDPDTIIRLATDLKDERERRREAEADKIVLAARIEADRPKVAWAETAEKADTDILIGTLAGLITKMGVEIGEKRLFEWMRLNGFLCSKGRRRNNPTQVALECGILTTHEMTVGTPRGFKLKFTPLVTPKGQEYFIGKFLKLKRKAPKLELHPIDERDIPEPKDVFRFALVNRALSSRPGPGLPGANNAN